MNKPTTYFVLFGLLNGEEGMQALTTGFGKQQPDGWYVLAEGMDDGVGPYTSKERAEAILPELTLKQAVVHAIDAYYCKTTKGSTEDAYSAAKDIIEEVIKDL